MPEKSTHTYKNISGHAQELMGFGVVQAGGTIKTSAIITNGNFALQDEPKEKELPTIKTPKK